jgi:hypothetical protein
VKFREGMQAVKECMQKNTGMIDDDRYGIVVFKLKLWFEIIIQ